MIESTSVADKDIILDKKQPVHSQDDDQARPVFGIASDLTRKDSLNKPKKVRAETKAVCSICGKGFTAVGNLNIHTRLHTGQKTFCTVCGRGFSQKYNLKEHMRTHTGEKVHCDVCGKAFTRKRSLSIHKRIHTGEKFYCKVCGKAFSVKANLNEHKRKHTGEKFKCITCGKEFAQKRTLKKHKRKHSDLEGILTCEVCGEGFHEQSSLDEHQQLHTIEKFYCTVCGKDFATKSALSEHEQQSHTPPRIISHYCKVCGKGFTNRKSLYRHKRIHPPSQIHPPSSVGEICSCTLCKMTFNSWKQWDNHLELHKHPQHFCFLCGKGFLQKKQLYEHEQVHISLGEVFNCTVCEKYFSTSETLNEHLLIHSRERHVGAICGKGFTQKKKLDEKFHCTICGKAFAEKQNLISHRSMHWKIPTQPYFCRLCKKSFTLESELVEHTAICDRDFSAEKDLVLHKRIHTGVGIESGVSYLVCKICSKSFSRKDHLLKHMRSHVDKQPNCHTVSAKANTGKNGFILHKGNPARESSTCRVCDKTFAQGPEMTLHMRTHADKTIFYCSVCDKYFSEEQDAAEHMKNHSIAKTETDRSHFVREEPNTSCSICGKTFYKSDLVTLTHINLGTTVEFVPYSEWRMFLKGKSIDSLKGLLNDDGARSSQDVLVCCQQCVSSYIPCSLCGKEVKFNNVRFHLGCHLGIFRIANMAEVKKKNEKILNMAKIKKKHKKIVNKTKISKKKLSCMTVVSYNYI